MKRNTLQEIDDSSPGASGRMSLDEFLALPEGHGARFELHAGRLVRKPVAGGAHDVIIHRLDLLLGGYIEENDLGQVTLSQGGYDVAQPGDAGSVVWIPDFAFVREDRAPADDSPEWSRPWRLAPDLTVEVVSPSQFRPEMEQRPRDWLGRGVRIVWIIWPESRAVDVWRSQLTGAAESRTLTEMDFLEGADVIPGFTCEVARLFKRVRTQQERHDA